MASPAAVIEENPRSREITRKGHSLLFWMILTALVVLAAFAVSS
jgi:hypothetical protein